MKRHRSSPKASRWNAIAVAATVYQSNENVKIVRRPKRSATKPNSKVPTNKPKKNAATKPARPVVPNSPGVVAVRMPLLTSPGPT